MGEHDTYRKWNLPKPQMREPEARVSLPFDSDTKYHADYTPKSAGKGKSAGQQTPLAGQKAAKGPEQALDDHTTNYEYYKKWDLPKQEAPQAAPKHNVPFEGMSTEHDTYRKWNLPKPQMREPEARVSLQFQGETTYHAQHGVPHGHLQKPAGTPSGIYGQRQNTN